MSTDDERSLARQPRRVEVSPDDVKTGADHAVPVLATGCADETR